MALSKGELLQMKIKAITTKPRNEALWAAYFAELAKFNAYAANMPKPDLKARLEFIVSEAAKIEDTAEREEFKRGAMAGLFSDLAAYRKAHPPKKSVAAKVLSAYGKGWKIAGKTIQKGAAFGVDMVGSIIMIPLSPFIPALKKMLETVRAVIPDDMESLIVNTYNKVLGKQGYDCYDENGNYSIPRYHKLYVDPKPTEFMIKALQNYFKDLKSKALKDPESLNPTEKQIYLQVVKGEKVVHELAKEKVAQTLGEKIIKYKTPIILTGLGLLVLIGGSIAYAKTKKAS